jgi:hypothetical protein
VSELRESLDEALRTVTAGDPPVEETIRRGKSIRMRRRVAAIASVAAVAVLAGVGYPAVTHLGAAPAPPVARHEVGITEVPPGRGAAPGEVASGKIGTKTWRLILTQSGPGNQCATGHGTAFVSGITSFSCGVVMTPGTEPVQWEGLDDAATEVSFGPVADDVTHILVRLADGEELRLIPARVYGVRLVAFAAPVNIAVLSVTAYLSDGQYRTAIPFSPPGQPPTFAMWLRPGQPGPPRATRLVGTGTVDGQRWTLTSYEGPWGTCWVGQGAGAASAGCSPVAPFTRTAMLSASNVPVQVDYGSAAPQASFVVLTLTNGHTMRVGVVTIGNEKAFAFALGNGQTLHRWTAYDAAGNPLSSGGPLGS